MFNQQMDRFAAALDRVAGDRQLLAEMAKLVAVDAPRVLNKITRDIERESFAQLADDAHALKGMLVSFETGDPVAHLEEVIIAARKGLHEEAVSMMDSQRGDIDRLIQDISQVAAG